MTKLPVADAIRFAYGFAFGQIGAIIGLVWLPLLIVAVLQFLPYAVGTAYSSAADPAQAAGAALLNVAFSAAALVLYAMNCVAVTRQALGLRKGAASFHFQLGRPEWRMFAAIVICGLMLVSAIGIYVMVGTAVFPAARGAPALAVLVAVYALVGFCAVAWFALRLVFLLAPVVVAEERVDLVRAWMLSRRNFWRMLAVILAVAVPLLLVQVAALAAIIGPGLFTPLPAGAAGAAAALQERFALFDQHMPSMIGLALVLAPFSLGLTLGAASFSYRALVPAQPAARAV
ncbi:MAG TPA: hypothetical protein VIY09_00890 [Rhizomicrobium sp.]